MGLMFNSQDGQTPIDDDEKEGLRIQSISTRNELNEFEQQNIEQAILWSMKKRFNIDELLSIEFVCALHHKMFHQVWKWAGKFRASNKNIGVDKWQISTELKMILDDVRFWHENKVYPPDELVIRFKHRLVLIHCFPNGNGRHSRLMADIIISNLYKFPIFSWGAKQHKTREDYLQAIRKADRNDFSELIDFARS